MIINARQEMFLKAMSFYGLKEIPGEEHNPQILEFFEDIGHEWIVNDETAWCSAFINWLAMKAGLESSGKLNARSWMDVGEEIKEPVIGKDVVVFWRVSKDDWRGHVGIYSGEDDDHIFTLGGNQSNMVCIKPYKKYQVLGYRRLGILRDGGPKRS